MTTGILEKMKSLRDLQQRCGLQQATDDDFFLEWETVLSKSILSQFFLAPKRQKTFRRSRLDTTISG